MGIERPEENRTSLRESAKMDKKKKGGGLVCKGRKPSLKASDANHVKRLIKGCIPA